MKLSKETAVLNIKRYCKDSQTTSYDVSLPEKMIYCSESRGLALDNVSREMGYSLSCDSHFTFLSKFQENLFY